MRKMIDSGISWIGKVPESWKLEKIKYISQLNGRIGWQGLTSEEYRDEGPFLITGTDFIDGGINWETCVRISEERWKEANKIQIENGDLLITKDGTVGKVSIVKGLYEKASLNSGVMKIGLNSGFSKKFMYYILISDVFWKWFNYKNAGNSTILHLYQKDFNEFFAYYPSEGEQISIADFLDDRCSQIDLIISRIEKQIELLKEYKKALITETVTKGLDKNVPMKDSGLARIGDMPRGWEVKRLLDISHINKFSLSENTSHDLNIKYVDISSVSYEKGIESYEEMLFSQSPSRARRIVNAGDTIISTVRTYLKAIAYVESDESLIVSTGFAVLSPKELIFERFLYYVVTSGYVLDEIDKLSYGIAYPAINTSALARIKIIIPSKDEQHKISSFLDKKCTQIDTIVNKKEKQIALIEEHRKSLIYEYVTGKKRVEGYHGD